MVTQQLICLIMFFSLVVLTPTKSLLNSKDWNGRDLQICIKDAVLISQFVLGAKHSFSVDHLFHRMAKGKFMKVEFC